MKPSMNLNHRAAAAVCAIISLVCAFTTSGQIPPLPGPDWLLHPEPYTAIVADADGGRSLVLQNGLLMRKFRLQPNLATVDFRNLMTGEAITRAVRPEAILTLNGKKYTVGGLEGQEEQGYLLDRWVDSLRRDPSAFACTGHEIGEPKEWIRYERKRWGADAAWPPRGKSVTFHFLHPSKELAGIRVSVHYEMEDGIPLLVKWITVTNQGNAPVRLDSFVSENLAVVEPEVSVDPLQEWDRPNIYVGSDYAFHGMSPKSSNRTTYWVTDSLFTSQVNYDLKTPCVLESRPPLGPAVDITPGGTFTSYRTFELIYDSYDRERKGLALRRMYRTVAPWVTENPIFLHLTSTDTAVVKAAVDQCVETGFEMIILSFGSGVDMETSDEASLRRMKQLADYAHSKGIELGGYSLLASRRISDSDDVINPSTGTPGGAIFGNSPCLGSAWGEGYFTRLKHFLEATGFDLLEHDGSYPGDVCASTHHPGHRGLEDSQWKQWEEITGFYRWCRERNIYLNVPDYYFLNGSNKTGIGYREVNWSLPRDRQIILGRQNLFDGTWEKTPSMGWTFVPLVEYQGGGSAATLEPLAEHLDAYQAHLVQNFGAGVQACYRGSRLYDTPKTKELVRSWVHWYKQHRAILNSDVVHLRRPDGRDLDYILHVNPALGEKGLLMVYNPTDSTLARSMKLPLYYTGLTQDAHVRERDGQSVSYVLDRAYTLELAVSVEPHGFTWYVIE
jgi:hypothetical protein